jgi:hypothetical protein
VALMGSRLVLAGLALFSLCQDSGVEKMPALLEKAEKLGMSVPDLPQAVAELEAIAARGGPDIKPDWTHRLQVLQSRSVVTSALHGMFTESVGAMMEVPLIGGRKDKAKIVGVAKNSVDVQQGTVKMTLAFADFDAEWVVGKVEKLMPEPALPAGLFLAAAAKWEAASRCLAQHPTRHPLAVEARKRGLERVTGALEKAMAAKKWTAAFEALKTMEAVDGDAAEKSRETLRDALVAHAVECARKKAKSEMSAAIALLERHYPDEKNLAAQIRDELRWIILNDPKLFELTGRTGAPFVLVDDKSDGYSRSAYCQKDQGACDGLGARITVKDLKGGLAGFAWQQGLVNLWIDHNAPSVGIGSLNKERQIQTEWSEKIDRAETYDVSVVIEKGEYVVRVNGKEAGRCASKYAVLGPFCIKVTENTATFDLIRIRKK